MWTRRVTAIAAGLVLAACAEPAPEPADESPAMTDEEAIAAVADYWETHYNMQHPDMVASRYTDDAWVSPANGGWFEGREQVEGWLAANTAASPTADIMPMETVGLGDRALSMGRYSVSTTGPDGNAMEFSGAYMNELSKVDGEWRIAGSMTNYDADPPDGMQWNAMPEGDAPPDIENQLSGLVEEFEAAWNGRDAAGVAALYADGARAAFSNGPILMGPDGIEAAMAERIPEGVSLVIHQVAADPIDDTHWSSGGWYEMAGPDGSTVQTGMWWNVIRMTDGSPEIVWTISNAFPMEM